LDTAGAAVWRSIKKQLGTGRWTPERSAQAHELSRLKDRADQLDQLLRDAESLVERDDKGALRAHPAMAEARAVALTMARLTAALESAFAEKKSRGGQHGVRGSYKPRTTNTPSTGATVSALARARARKASG
jgi:hypothetical protein